MENHAWLGCQAALHLDRSLRELAQELRRTVGIGLSTQMGLHSAETVLGAIGHCPGKSGSATPRRGSCRTTTSCETSGTHSARSGTRCCERRRIDFLGRAPKRGILSALSPTVRACRDPIQAERLTREALELSRGHAARGYELGARLSRAHAALAGRQAFRADEIACELAQIEQAIGVAGVRRAAPDLHCYLARLGRLIRDEDTYERGMERTRALYVELGAPARADRLLATPD